MVIATLEEASSSMLAPAAPTRNLTAPSCLSTSPRTRCQARDAASTASTRRSRDLARASSTPTDRIRMSPFSCTGPPSIFLTSQLIPTAVAST